MIFVECNNDYDLVNYIISRRNLIGHSGGKSRVLQDVLDCNDICVGIIDEDPESHREPKLDNFIVENDSQTYKVYSNLNVSKKIFEFKNDLETWLRIVSASSRIPFERSGILNNRGKIQKNLNSYQKRQFRQFLESLAETSLEFRALMDLLKSTFD